MTLLRQRLYNRRTIIGVVASLCLLFHVLLPSLVNLALVPRLLYMPTHCPSSATQNAAVHAANKQFPLSASHAATHTASHFVTHANITGMHHGVAKQQSHFQQHLHQQKTKHSQQHYAIHHSNNHHQHHTRSSADVVSLLFSSVEVKQIIDQAQQLMKHCPLCSHGLEGAVLVPLLVLLLLVILRLFAPVQRVFAGWSRQQHIQRIRYSWPYKHGPPLAL